MFNQQQTGFGQGSYDGGDRLVDRVMAFEYNQAVQRGDYRQAQRTIFQIFGTWLWQRIIG